MKKLHIVFTSVGLALLSGAIVASNVVIGKYSQVLKAFLGSYGRRMTSVNYDGVDRFYYKTENTKESLQTNLDELGDKVAEEGIVVLEKGNIPYDTTGNNFSLFSKSSVDFVFGGTGSGVATGKLNLKEAFEKAGFKVNSSLWNFYENGGGSSYKRGIGSINYGDSDDFSINEVPISVIKNDSGLTSSFKNSNVGVFVLSRTGGEGNDLARGMYDYVDTSKDKNAGVRSQEDKNKDRIRSYLEPDSIELGVMQYINDNFDDFILIVNCNNAMELGFAKQFDKLKTIVQIPSTGGSGLDKLPEILKGSIASSGRLADTFVTDSFAIPSSYNIGDFEYLVDGNKVGNIFDKNNFDGLYYMNYDESIYVGYRYFETRYADTFINNVESNASQGFNYSENVIYPFGYGDSIVDFEYSNFSCNEVDGKFKISVDVKNVGALPAKHAVELYMSTPYGVFEKDNNVEKSAIELVDFNKTKTLNADETQTISFEVSKDQLLSYSEKLGKYYLSGGTYYFTIGYDAHSAINNVLRKQGYSGLSPSPSEEEAGNVNLVKAVSIEQDLNSYVDLASNQFGFVNANTYNPSHKYLTRKDWVDSFPTIQGELSNITSIHSERTRVDNEGNAVGTFEYTQNLSKDSQIYKDVVDFATMTPELDLSNSNVKWGQKTNLDAVDLRGLDIDDPRYDEVVNAIKLKNAVDMFSFAGYETSSIKEINKPRTFDTDGPAGFNTVSGHNSIGNSYPCSLIIAQTWNKELMHEVGEGFGQESILYEIQGWYGPTANIHRSPFGGRNFEYFSEDPVLTGIAAKQELHGAATYGLYGYLKHFALNDQETHREKENGVCIFADEQTIRELYLKPFEMSIKNNTVEETYYELQRDENKNIIRENGQPKFEKKTTQVPACTAIMSAFSRLGGVWAGSCYPLLNNVLRDEWNFKGIVLTDYYHFWMMDKGQSLLGGGSLILDPQGNPFKVEKDDKLSQYMLHESTKQVLYTIVNSNAVNGYVHGVREKATFFKYYYVQIGANVAFAIGDIFLALHLVGLCTGKSLLKRKSKKNEA